MLLRAIEACLSASEIYVKNVIVGGLFFIASCGEGSGVAYSLVDLLAGLRADSLEVLLGIRLGLAGEMVLDVGGGSMGVTCG